MAILELIRMVFVIIWEIFHGRISLSLVLLQLLVNFVCGFRLEFDVYIPHRKNQIKPHSSPWFSVACAAAVAHRNHFFRSYQKDKSSASKVKFRQASNCCRRFLEALIVISNSENWYMPCMSTKGHLPVSKASNFLEKAYCCYLITVFHDMSQSNL